MLGRLDRYQRSHRWAGHTVAVVYKFVEDQGSYLAALITYYGFLSLFPMLLLLVTVLGFALNGNARLQAEVLSSALGQFPVLGDQLGDNIHSLHGSGFALTVGIGGVLYGALGVAQATQNALNSIWAVPQHERPNPLVSRLRSLLLLVVLGLGVAVTTVLAALATSAHSYGAAVAWGVRGGGMLLSVAVNAALIVLTFKALTARALPPAALWPEALAGAVVWQVLQAVGAYVVGHQLRGATATYGLFGIVLGLIAWLYLGAFTLVMCAESASVRHRGLHPRNLAAPFSDDARLTRADRRAFTSYATAAAQKPFEEVRVRFDEPRPGRAAEQEGPSHPPDPGGPARPSPPSEPPSPAPSGTGTGTDTAPARERPVLPPRPGLAPSPEAGGL
ncbi:YihY/virulence factor BrkB family protein [Kitasatospora sp. NBC_00315]|uniref:YihY/virulence factor BrkB family protein n=1 Tax=Kitasatospora sp. NBC_00315 TaxID=2975963 RepID=UPI00324B692A